MRLKRNKVLEKAIKINDKYHKSASKSLSRPWDAIDDKELEVAIAYAKTDLLLTSIAQALEVAAPVAKANMFKTLIRAIKYGKLT